MAALVISIYRVFGDGLIPRLVNSVRSECLYSKPYILVALGCPFKTMCSCHGKLYDSVFNGVDSIAPKET